MKPIIPLLLLLFLPGCAGTRESYKDQLKLENGKSVLQLKKGESTEILAVGNGFPGWWGYFPGVITTQENIASIECKEKRGLIPFREPGVVFGGTVCNLIAHEPGITMLYLGNQFTLTPEHYQQKIEVQIIE
ncbi:hypothetical protein [Alteromonas sp. 14N.309.X.WAT.G.H12]|uniref:hypothetical protein n=1 Tax=Alteromonas sp. 14N.309.X.WAT.G.H12 TaxID=3120824 RepID=UPI002FD77077